MEEQDKQLESQEGRKTLVATSVAHFTNDGSTFTFITLFPKLITIPSANFFIGILGALQNLFSIGTSTFVGRRADSSKKYGGLLALGISIIAIGIIGYSFSVLFVSGFSEFLFLVPFSIIGGIGSSFYHPLGAAAMNYKLKGKKIGQAVGLNGSMGSLGAAVYPLVVVALVVYFGVPSVVLLAVVAFGAAIFVYALLRGVDFSKRIGDENKTDKSENDKAATRVPMSVLVPPLLGLTIISFVKSMFSFGITNFIPVYLTADRNLGYELQLGIVLTAMQGAGVFGQPAFGLLADRIGRRISIAISIAGSTIAMLLFLSTSSLLASALTLAMFGFFVYTGFPLLMPLAASIAPEGSATISGSIVWGIGGVGGRAVGPFLIGLLSEPGFLGSLTNTFYLMIIISTISLVILPFVPKGRAEQSS